MRTKAEINAKLLEAEQIMILARLRGANQDSAYAECIAQALRWTLGASPSPIQWFKIAKPNLEVSFK